MSKKKLLEESTVRSFMKLANLAPLSDKFIKEEWSKEEGLQEAEHEEESKEEEGLEEAKHEEEEEEAKMEESTHVMMGRGDKDRMQGHDVAADRAVDEAKEEEEEVVAEVEDMSEEEKLEEGDADGLKPLKAKMGTGGKPVQSHQGKTKATPASVSVPNQGPTKSKVPGVQGMKKIASKDPNNGKFKPLKVNTKDVSHGTPVKLSESLEEEEMGPPPEGEAPTPSDEAGESAEHQETVKGALQKMLAAMQDIAKEYGVDMAVDAGGEMEEPEGGEMEEPEGETPEAPPPAGEEEGKMMQETLDILTKRVAARLLKRK